MPETPCSFSYFSLHSHVLLFLCSLIRSLLYVNPENIKGLEGQWDQIGRSGATLFQVLFHIKIVCANSAVHVVLSHYHAGELYIGTPAKLLLLKIILRRN
jgi:hypothetical protein